MRDKPVPTFTQLLTGHTGDQAALPEALRWFTVVLYRCFLPGGLAIAGYVWRRDPLQRAARNIGSFLTRSTTIGLWYLGSLWKLPLPVSGGFKSRMDKSAKYNQFAWDSSFMQMFVEHISAMGPLVYLLEISLTASRYLAARGAGHLRIPTAARWVFSAP